MKPTGARYWQASYSIRENGEEQLLQVGVVAGVFDSLEQAEREALRHAQDWIDGKFRP